MEYNKYLVKISLIIYRLKALKARRNKGNTRCFIDYFDELHKFFDERRIFVCRPSLFKKSYPKLF
jgi:hypothetical protein